MNYYEGELNNENKPHGKGKITYGSNSSIYEGEFESGKPHGAGKMTFKSGVVYEGGFSNGKYKGIGKLTNNGDIIFEGVWDDNIPTGNYADNKIFLNGSIYKGEFNDAGKPYGRGQIVYPMGEKYEGDVVDGLPHGKGVWIGTDGSTQNGGWKEGKHFGEHIFTYSDGMRVCKKIYDDNGTYYYRNFWQCCYVPELVSGTHKKTFNNGDYFDGEWLDGQFVKGKVKISFGGGISTVTFNTEIGADVEYNKTSARFEGYLVNEQFNGHGVMLWPSGSRYEGEWQNDAYHGKGILLWPDGARYEGECTDNKFNGQGIFTYADGRCYKGFFKDDKFHGSGVMYDANGTIEKEGEWQNGKFIEEGK